MNQLLASSGQSIGASASVFPINIYGWFPLGLSGFISLLSKGLSRVPPTPQFKSINSSALSLLYGPTLTSVHDCWKNHSFAYTDSTSKVTSLLFNTLSPLVVAFLPRSERLWISWLQSLQWFRSPRSNLSLSPLFPRLFPMKWWDQMPWSLFSECWALSQPFHSPLSLSFKRLFSSSLLSAIRVGSSAYLRWLIFLLAILIPACDFTWCTLHISSISRVTIYSLDVLLCQFGISLLFHVQF